MSKTVELRQVAITDLSVRYARDLGDNKVKHYRVTHMASLLGLDPVKLISEYITREEGECSVSFLFPTPGKDDRNVKIVNATTILDNDKDIKKALEKVKSRGVIHQYITFPTLRDKFLLLIHKPYNAIANFVNKVMATFRTLGMTKEQKEEAFYNGAFINKWYMRGLGSFGERKLDLVRYLTIAFEEGDEEEAAKALIADLRNLKNKDLIVGHLAMPGMVQLADTVGLGKKRCVLFCFVIVNTDNLFKALGKKPEEATHNGLLLNEVGCKYESLEGGINWLNNVNPENKYSIEVVDIMEGTRDADQQAVIAQYEEQRALIKKKDEIAYKRYLEEKKKNSGGQ